MTPEDVVRNFCQAVERADVRELAAFFTDDAVYHNVPIAPVTGRAAIEATLAQFIVDDDFPPVEVTGPFDKRELDPAFVREREQLITRGWRRLKAVAHQEIPIIEYPLPEVIEKIRRRDT